MMLLMLMKRTSHSTTTTDSFSQHLTTPTYLAAYRAIMPARKGSVMNAIPAMAMGSFSASDILSVFLWFVVDDHTSSE